MELFSACLTSRDGQEVWKLSRYLSEAFAPLHTASGADALEWDIDAKHGRIRCLELSDKGTSPLSRHEIIRHAADGLANYILHELEPGLLRSVLRKESGYTEADELEKLEKICLQLLYGEKEKPTPVQDEQRADWMRRHSKITEELQMFMKDSPFIHVQGFVAFRLSLYWRMLKETVEYAVDEYIMEKQYQDFISLLRYFVGLQDTKTTVVHLFQLDDGQFQLCNYQLRPLEYKHSDRIVAEMLEAEMNVEDRVVSSLIAASPRQIVIHSKLHDQQVIRTIQSIFGDRVMLCASCVSCQAFYEV